MKIEHTSNLPGLIEKIYRYGDGGLDFHAVDALSTLNAVDAINKNAKHFIIYAIKDKKDPLWKGIKINFKREGKEGSHYICKFSFEI